MSNKYVGPHKEIPEEMLNGYTMDGRIPVFPWFIRGDTPQPERLQWTPAVVESHCQRFTRSNILSNRHGWEPYGNASRMLVASFDKYLPPSASVAVIGSLDPWIEAILVNYGSTDITTVEYNVPVCSDNRINTLAYTEFEKISLKYDVIVTYSSIEHAGLGRYGDPLDPDGDLKAMAVMHRALKKGGFLLCAFPVGKDALVWNAHRIYGHIRLPLMLENFIEVEWYGGGKDYLNYAPLTKNCTAQPVIVLRKE